MMTLKLLEVMPNVHAGRGIGSVVKHELCVMAMCAAEDRLRRGEPIGEATDQCKCVSPLLRTLAIAKNDSWWESDKERTAWALDLYPRLLGTRDEARDVRRAAAVARYEVRVIAAEALRSAKLFNEAKRLASLPEDVRLDVAEAAAKAAAKAAATAVSDVTARPSRAARAKWATKWAAVAAGAAQAALDAVDDARVAQAIAESAEAATRVAQAIARDSTGLDDLLRVAMETE